LNKRPRNLIGGQVKKLRLAKGWTQDDLASRLQRAGWDVSRIDVAKLELGLRRVPDVEVMFLAKVLSVPLAGLFPEKVDLKTAGPAYRRTLPKDKREPPPRRKRKATAK
jgi:transcriptional regulator with XRE-family HTH domain